MTKSAIDQLKEDYWLTYMIHLLAKEYGWSKEQVNQVYPEEVGIYIQFIASEKKDKLLQEKLEYYQKSLDALYIAHGKPEEHRDRFIKIIENLQEISIQINPDSEGSNSLIDEDLPDLESLHRLKEFKQFR